MSDVFAAEDVRYAKVVARDDTRESATGSTAANRLCQTTPLGRRQRDGLLQQGCEGIVASSGVNLWTGGAVRPRGCHELKGDGGVRVQHRLWIAQCMMRLVCFAMSRPIRFRAVRNLTPHNFATQLKRTRSGCNRE